MNAYKFTIVTYDDGEEMTENGYIFASRFDDAVDRLSGAYGEDNICSVRVELEESDLSAPMFLFSGEPSQVFFF